MATLIPSTSTLKSGATPGERKFARHLKVKLEFLRGIK